MNGPTLEKPVRESQANMCDVSKMAYLGSCKVGTRISKQFQCRFHAPEFHSPRCNHLHLNCDWCMCDAAVEDAKKAVKNES